MHNINIKLTWKYDVANPVGYLLGKCFINLHRNYVVSRKQVYFHTL